MNKYKIGQKVRAKSFRCDSIIGIINEINDDFYIINNIAFFENELEPINEFNMKQLYKPALGVFILVMIYIALKGCGKDKPITNNSIKKAK